jgi:branched-chain amino acid transport system ATP-binding protein
VSAPEPAASEAVLQTEHLSVSFGGVHANRDLDVRVERGQLVGLIGPNGAGKTTFIDALTGFVTTSGRILFGGRDITGWPAHRRAQAGLVRTWQSTELFNDLTVRENLMVGADKAGLAQVVADFVAPGRKQAARTEVDDALARFELDRFADRMPSDLSHGQRKLVGVARALAARPQLVLVDEPAAGLDSRESKELGRHLRGVVDNGPALLLIDHDMDLVLSVCDYVYVLDAGLLIAEGDPATIRRDPRVLTAYLGEDPADVEVDLSGNDATGARA